MRLILVSLLLVVYSRYLAAQQLQGDITPRDYSILYTGRLLGYARIPDEQIFNSKDSDPKPNSVALEYLNLIRDQRPRKPGGQILLLGMGDNFAPNLLSRIAKFQMPNPPILNADRCVERSGWVPKDRVYPLRLNAGGDPPWVCWNTDVGTDASEDQRVSFDNVGQFFIAAHYDALVPGKHDFYFGVARLQQLATYLADNNVAMLGENLVITTTRAPGFNNTAHPRIPDAYAGNLHPKINTDFGPTSLNLPSTVLPWLCRFLLTNARMSTGEHLVDEQPPDGGETNKGSWICWAGNNDPNPWAVGLPDNPASHCTALRVLEGQPAKPAQTDVTFTFTDHNAMLHPGQNHLFCTHLLPNAQFTRRNTHEWSCQPFPVQRPFFPDFQGKPYRVSCADKAGDQVSCAKPDAGGIAVFGVVDPDLMKNVGLLNDSWLNVNHSYDTIVTTTDVKDTLKQVLDLCREDPTCNHAPKVLMAQMSPARAAALLAAFETDFDVVISQADAELSTGNVDLTKNSKSAAKSNGNAEFILTPAFPVDVTSTTEEYIPQVARAHITGHTPDNSAQSQHNNDAEKEPSRQTPSGTKFIWRLTNRIHTGEAVVQQLSRAADGAPTLSSLSVLALRHQHIGSPADHPPPPSPKPESPSDPVQQLTLTAMRDYYHADIALLQKRDFYDADNLSRVEVTPDKLQTVIDKILWKSDFATVLHLTGATLKKLVKQSKKFQELDDSAVSTEIEKGRALVMVGLFNDPRDSDTFYVNGVKMNDTTLYSVVGTDYLAAGDTGYADLAMPDVPPATRVEDFNNVRTIGALLCRDIVKYQRDTQITGYCDDEKLGLDYFDEARNARPFDDTPGFNTPAHYATIAARVTRHPDMPTKGAEHSADQRHFWSLDLNNMDFSFSGTFIDRYSNVQRNFTGVSATGVTTNGSSSYGADHNLRLTWDFGQGTLYWLFDSAFARNTATTPLGLGWNPPSIAENNWGFEEGGTLRLPWRPLRPRPYWLSFEYLVRYEPEIIQPAPSQISYMGTVPATPGTNTTLFLQTPKSETLYGRVGLRGDHNDTFFEAGLEYADFRNILVQYQFNGVGLFCQPSASAEFVCGADPSPNSPADNTPITSELNLIANDTRPSNTALTSYLDPGFYLNFNLKFPLLSRVDTSGNDQSWYLGLMNKGNFFFNKHGDTSVQTRYLDKVSPSLTIPIFGKLALTPRMDVILYEDKVVRKHYVAFEPSVSLSYSFHWRQGLGWARTFGYGGIATTPPVSIPPP